MKIANILNALGLVLTAFGIIILAPIIVALLQHEYDSIIPFVTASFVSLSLGFFFQQYGGFSRNFDDLKINEGLLGWVWACCVILEERKAA